MVLLSLLTGLALTLGAVGIYGVLAHFGTRHRRDWAIRSALGLSSARVILHVARHGAVLVGSGIAIGVAAAVGLTRLLSHLLHRATRRVRSGAGVLLPGTRDREQCHDGGRLRWFLRVLGLAVGLAAACGGGGDKGPTQPAQSDTTLTASLDGGTSFTAARAAITSTNGRLLIVASYGPNESMGLGFDLRTGTQSSGTGGTATASYVRIGQGSWAAGPNLATNSGTLTLTTASANRVVERSVSDWSAFPAHPRLVS